MQEYLKNLLFPVLLLLVAGGLTVAVVWNGALVSPAPQRPVTNDFESVERQLSPQEENLIEFFQRIPEEGERLIAGRNPFYVEPPEPEPEPEPEGNEENGAEDESGEELDEEPEEEPEPPPPPRRVEIRYLGYLRGSEGASQAYLVRDGTTLIGAEGMTVVDDWRVNEFDAHRLVMVDDTGEGFEVEFGRSRILEIPVEPEDG